ncbi:hypothetical protein HDV63DRAFT_410026 [Trichoderma sp. SZMC 28014]
MPSADESSSSSIGPQEKLPLANHDSASITPRWAPGFPDVPSLSSPLARVAESFTNCCTFGWQQQPAGYAALPPPAAVVYEPPQQPVMEVLPPMPDQTTNSLQHTVPDNGESSQQAQLPSDEFVLNPFIAPHSGELSQQASLSTDLLSLNPQLGIVPQVGQVLLQEPVSDDLFNLDCLQFIAPDNGQSLQQPVFSNDLLNFDPSALQMYPAFNNALVQELPHSVYTDQLASTSHEQHSQLDSHHDGSTQFASTEPFTLPMNQAIIGVPPEDGIPIGGTPGIGGSSPLRHGPAPDLHPARPLLVDIETTPSNVYNYNVPSAQNSARPTTQPAIVEEKANAVAQKQHPTADNQQRNDRPNKTDGFLPQVQDAAHTTRLPCVRYKITDMTLYKTGQVPGYEWTHRWTKGTSDPITLWASSEIRTVYISVHYSKERLPLKVRRFVPQEGDKLERTWAHQGTKKSALIPPYALVDVEAGTLAYTTYIRESMRDIFQTMLGEEDDLLYKTYLLAYCMWQKEDRTSEAFSLLNWTLRLWVAIRLSTTSAFIVGKETLDMSANILDESNPDHGKIPLPPVMGAQMDMILIHHIQNKLRHELLDNLQKVMLRNKPKSWLVTYLVSFILLHNIALITKHDAGYATKHGMNTLTYMVFRSVGLPERKKYENIIWGRVPFSEECEDKDLRALAQLDEDKIRFVRATRGLIQQHQQEWNHARSNGIYEDDYYFVSQLFDEKWQPSTTNV